MFMVMVDDDACLLDGWIVDNLSVRIASVHTRADSVAWYRLILVPTDSIIMIDCLSL